MPFIDQSFIQDFWDRNAILLIICALFFVRGYVQDCACESSPGNLTPPSVHVWNDICILCAVVRLLMTTLWLWAMWSWKRGGLSSGQSKIFGRSGSGFTVVSQEGELQHYFPQAIGALIKCLVVLYSQLTSSCCSLQQIAAAVC